MFYVCIIKNKNERYYIGQTNNLEERIKMHNGNRVQSTRNKGPWEFVITKECSSRSKAMQLEQYLKSLKNSHQAITYLGTIG